MAGIYERDQLNLQAALADALNRRERYRARQNERTKNSIGEFGKIAETLGRTYEVGFTPEDDDNPEYRAARERYITTGDRSGLYQYEAAKRAKAEAEANRAFQASEAEKNRAFQASEGAANRALQERQMANNQVLEKARYIRNVADSRALVQDIKDNPSKYSPLDIARANNDVEMQISLAEKSGWFTPTEIRQMQGLPANITPPFRPDYVPPVDGAAASAQSAPEQTYKMVAPELATDIANIKTWDDYNAANEKFGGLNKDEYNSEDYEKKRGDLLKAEAKLKQGDAARAFANARKEAAANVKFNVYDIRKALNMGKAGGGNDTGDTSFTFEYNGKTHTVPVKIKRTGGKADLVLPDGTTFQTISLF